VRRERREGGEPDDGTLVARARSGDGAAYAALVERYRGVALRVAQRITGEPDEAEDAAQDAFVKAYAHLPRFRGGAPFRPWLLQIVANEAKNRRTAAARRSALERRATEESAARNGQFGGAVAAPEATPEEAALADEERRIVADALRELRDEDRTAITYRYVHDLSEAEMAAALGVARGTVKSRLSRAMTRLRAVAMPALLAALLLALAGGALALFPAARSAIAQRLGLRGVSITHVPALPEVPDAPAAPAAQPLGRRLGLGEPVTLQSARARLAFAPLLPAPSDLGEPDEVYASTEIPGGRLTLLYKSRPALPEAGTAGVGLLVTELRGTVNAGVVLAKQLGPSTRLEEVAVNGRRGYWIEGQPHVVLFRDANGVVRDETLRLAGNTLLWEQDELTLRIELAGRKEEALRIAASMAR
jgi:RNA polymerase sigma-70 factor (ECF subfamily)